MRVGHDARGRADKASAEADGNRQVATDVRTMVSTLLDAAIDNGIEPPGH
jgi:hypothetical protein